jgi:uncharacterized damage-inducible protein DinB
MRTLLCCLVLVAVAVPALGQEPAGTANPAVHALMRSLGQVQGFIIQAAEQVSEADYTFKPTPDVRSFGKLIGHVADSNYAICAAVLGETAPATDIEEKKTTKADLVAAAKASFGYCDKAFALPDAEAFKVVTLFGKERPRFNGLLLNVNHDWEHYGNIVTYMRLKGLVPPSSQPKK